MVGKTIQCTSVAIQMSGLLERTSNFKLRNHKLVPYDHPDSTTYLQQCNACYIYISSAEQLAHAGVGLGAALENLNGSVRRKR